MAEYIEREAAITEVAMMAEDRRIPVDSYGGEVVGEVIRLLRRIPAADVRPVVKSRWIKMKFFPDWECEKCGSVISGNTPDPWNHYHYCPHCGSDMRIFSTNCKNTATTGEDRERGKN